MTWKSTGRSRPAGARRRAPAQLRGSASVLSTGCANCGAVDAGDAVLDLDVVAVQRPAAPTSLVVPLSTRKSLALAAVRRARRQVGRFEGGCRRRAGRDRGRRGAGRRRDRGSTRRRGRRGRRRPRPAAEAASRRERAARAPWRARRPSARPGSAGRTPATRTCARTRAPARGSARAVAVPGGSRDRTRRAHR